jgi:hypothetical protein
MIKVFSTDNSAEAHFICGLLRANEIDAEVRGDYLLSAAGAIPLFGGAEASVWIINDTQQNQAEQVIANKAAAPVHDNWRCPQCGEFSEDQFSACWQCGHTRG